MADHAASNQSHTIEYFTQMPNRYLDYIAPKLSSTERDVAEVIIRFTKGYHVASAFIPNRVFMSRIGKSEPTIIKAKKSLIDLGLLVVVNDGGGATTTEYMIDLYYNNPDKSIKAQLDRQDEQSEELSIEDGRLSVQDDVIPTESDIAMDTQPIESDSQKADAPHELSTVTDTIVTGPDVGVTNAEPEVDHLSSTSTDVPAMEVGATSSTIATISDAHVPTESIVTDSNAIPTTKVSLVLPSKDLDLSSKSLNKKHTEADTTKNTPEVEKTTSTKQQVATVRFQFLSIFPENKADDDWQFFGWVTKEYGLEACLAKLDYMKEHRKQHSINNPKGFFRTALVRDFQPPAFVVAKLKADETAKRAKEKSQKESEEWRQRTTNFNYGASAASLQKLLNNLN